MLDAKNWNFPVPIYYGRGRIAELGRICIDLGIKKPLLVSDKGSENMPFMASACRALANAGLDYGTFVGFSANPRDTEAASGKACYREGGYDGIVAIGGGSGMDGAKSICLTANNDIELWEFDLEKTAPEVVGSNPFPPLITVPTTSGTGAETESIAMITETTRMMKLAVWHPRLRPSAAILDPELVVTLPPKLTAWTGCDAYVHAIEAYCVPDFHPMCDGVAIEAVRLIRPSLPLAYKDGMNIEARAAMHVGSCLAGVAFNKGLGLVHSISHMIGAEFDNHHGLLNGVVLPAVLRFNKPAIDQKIATLSVASGLGFDNFDDFYSDTCGLLNDLDIPTSLRDLGIPEDAETLDRLAEKAFQDIFTAVNPRKASLQDVRDVILDAFRHGR